MSAWTPASWRNRTAAQQPVYCCAETVRQVVAELAKLPPLVTSWEVDALKAQLADAARGRRFLLQGGDCVERFEDCESDAITNKLKILLQMSLVLVQGSKKRLIRVGRFAGQYAKPRSEEMETRGGVSLPSYRGDLINGAEFTARGRTADPQLMLRGYERAALTLNYIRALVKGGFADLHHPEYWDLGFADHSPLAEEYRRMVDSIGQSLHFMENVLDVRAGELNLVDFFTSHEGLHLPYEEPLTRRVPHAAGWYNLSTHFPWIGMRTSDAAGAHVEYFRGIVNPIGIKVGPALEPPRLLELLDILDPANEPGRITLIHRLGVRSIAALLPPFIDAVKRAGRTVVWCCDPMHGNTHPTRDGIKTRDFSDILGELEQAFDIHAAGGSYLGGVHVELTGENVTECTGGARGISEADLKLDYRSQVDPRLNCEQALELAMLVARKMHREAQ